MSSQLRLRTDLPLTLPCFIGHTVHRQYNVGEDYTECEYWKEEIIGNILKWPTTMSHPDNSITPLKRNAFNFGVGNWFSSD